MSGALNPNLYIFDANLALTLRPLKEILAEIKKQKLNLASQEAATILTKYLRPGVLNVLRYLKDRGQYLSFASAEVSEPGLEALLNLVFNPAEVSEIIDRSECSDVGAVSQSATISVKKIIEKEDLRDAAQIIVLNPTLKKESAELTAFNKFFTVPAKVAEQLNHELSQAESGEELASPDESIDFWRHFVSTPKSVLSFDAHHRLFSLSADERGSLDAWDSCINLLPESMRRRPTLSCFHGKSIDPLLQGLMGKPGLISAYVNEDGCLVFSYYLAEYTQVYSEVYAYHRPVQGGVGALVQIHDADPAAQAQRLKSAMANPNFCMLTKQTIVDFTELQSLALAWQQGHHWVAASQWMNSEDYMGITNPGLLGMIVGLRRASDELQAQRASSYVVDAHDHEDDDDDSEDGGLDWDDDDTVSHSDEQSMDSSEVAAIEADLRALGEYDVAQSRGGQPGSQVERYRQRTQDSLRQRMQGLRAMQDPDSESALYENLEGLAPENVETDAERQQKLGIILSLVNAIDWSRHAGLVGSVKDQTQSNKKLPRVIQTIKEILTSEQAEPTDRYNRVSAVVQKMQNSILGRLMRCMLNIPILKWFVPRSPVTQGVLELISTMQATNAELLQQQCDAIKAKQGSAKQNQPSITVVRVGSVKAAEFNGADTSVRRSDDAAIALGRTGLHDVSADFLAGERVRAQACAAGNDANDPDLSSFQAKTHVVASLLSRLPQGAVHSMDTSAINEAAAAAQESSRKKQQSALPFADQACRGSVVDVSATAAIQVC